MNRFKKGDKVKILSKSTGCSLDQHNSIFEGHKGDWYIIGVDTFNDEYEVSDSLTSDGGNYFREKDLAPTKPAKIKWL